MFRSIKLGLAVVFSLFAAGTAQAVSVPAVTYTDATFTNDPGSYNLGYEFTPTTAMSVTHLGYYDRGGDGLDVSSDVGISVTSTTALVPGATATVPTGTGGLLVGNASEGFYRYIALSSPVALTPGTSYRIAGHSGANNYVYQGYVGLTPNPNISLGSGYYSVGSLSFPSTLSPYSGGAIFGGGNFLLQLPEPPPAPEPSSAVLALGGLAVLIKVRRRQHQG